MKPFIYYENLGWIFTKARDAAQYEAEDMTRPAYERDRYRHLERTLNAILDGVMLPHLTEGL